MVRGDQAASGEHGGQRLRAEPQVGTEDDLRGHENACKQCQRARGGMRSPSPPCAVRANSVEEDRGGRWHPACDGGHEQSHRQRGRAAAEQWSHLGADAGCTRGEGEGLRARSDRMPEERSASPQRECYTAAPGAQGDRQPDQGQCRSSFQVLQGERLRHRPRGPQVPLGCSRGAGSELAPPGCSSGAGEGSCPHQHGVPERPSARLAGGLLVQLPSEQEDLP
mmetsp:Transcript_48172/g.151139  ORF Transcript_48172/g.151139 Transcript_48172/m.151139 type:complete len:223 (-) Transcript_48172:1010-1678(-)